MAFEVSCGQCQGRLMVEQAGVVVACPHCGSHLTVGNAPDQPAIAPAPQPSEPTSQNPAPTPPASNAPAELSAPDPIPSPVEAPISQPAVAPEINSPASEDVSDFSGFNPPASAQPENPIPDFVPPPINPDVPAISAGSSSTSPQPYVDEATQIVQEPASATEEFQTPAENASAGPSDAGQSLVSPVPARKKTESVSKTAFLLVLSYASAMTIAVAFLVWTKVLSPDMHKLESLPDLEPKRQDNKIAYEFVPWDAEMAPGHVLKIGDERRFGNLKVTATKVTRGPLEFVHFQGGDQKRDPAKNVLKLWLKFENMSEDQAIPPLRSLVYYRAPGKDFDHELSNNFVCRSSEKKKGEKGEFVLMYELNTNDVWNIAGQDSEHEIPPGGTYETFVATVENGADHFSGKEDNLIWRVHFRKGYSTRNHGVTTIVEVDFDQNEITDESAEPAKKDV